MQKYGFSVKHTSFSSIIIFIRFPIWEKCLLLQKNNVMQEIIAFLDRLMRNNNREWFNAHKDEYKYVQAKFNDFALKLMESVAAFDPDVYGLELKDCTYRIYRDIRFSSDKRPYKNHFGCFICKGGKKSGNAGYYFHIEPVEADYIGGNILAAGMYAPTKELLEQIRHEIVYDGDKLLGGDCADCSG